MAGGAIQGLQAQNGASADDTATAAQAQADATNAALTAQLLSGYRTQADRAGAPVPQYYTPQSSVPTQSPTLRVPGFQGVANPFYTAPPAQPAPTQASAQDLLSQYNAYRQKNAEALYQSRTAQLAQAQAMQKAYADAQAAAKAKAEADAARAARSRGPFGRIMGGVIGGGGGDYADGGLAALYRDQA